MDNNVVFRQIRYVFDFDDQTMIQLFQLADQKVSRAQVSNWLKQDDDLAFKKITDVELATFLNGLIYHKRGKEPGKTLEPEKRLNNNIIFRKLKIALNYTSDDILAIFKLADLRVSKHELSAIFRKPTQRQYRVCQDQFLRNFIQGLQLKYRPAN